MDAIGRSVSAVGLDHPGVGDDRRLLALRPTAACDDVPEIAVAGIVGSAARNATAMLARRLSRDRWPSKAYLAGGAGRPAAVGHPAVRPPRAARLGRRWRAVRWLRGVRRAGAQVSPGRAAAPAVPVILDVDTGIDDALALLLAAKSPALDLLAVSCVAGNAGVDQVVRNTLKVLDAADAADVSVARGADRPLLEPGRDARHVHGEDGMGDLGLPDSARGPVDIHAIELMRLTLSPLPPGHARVARADDQRGAAVAGLPHVAEHIERIVFMGGGGDRQRDRGGGVQCLARPGGGGHRPPAGCPCDVRARRLLRGDDRRGWCRTADRVTRPGGAACRSTAAAPARAAHRHHRRRRRGRCGHRPGGLTTSRHPVWIELAGTWTRGQTLVDRRSWAGDLENDPHGLPAAMVDVALGVDADRFRALFLETLGL